MTKPSYKELMARFRAVDMLPNNPFYILGLPSDATPRQIRRRKEDLDAAHELGDKDWNASFPYLLKGSSIPSFETVKEAFARLEDVEDRVVASYFWFWTPNGDAGDKFKPAFHSFISGDSESAKDSWQKIKDDYSRGICLTPFLLEKEPQEVVSEKIATALKRRKSILRCAKHNLGVLHRLRAMVVEYALITGNVYDDEESVNDLESNWQLALAYERKEDVGSPYIVYGEHVKVHQKYYEVFSALDFVTSDLQVSDGFLSLCSMITHDLPVVWQLRMIMAFSRKDDEDSVKRHISVIRKNIGWHSLSDSVLESAFGDMIVSHESLIKRYDEKVRLNHSEGLNAANDLFDATSKDYDAVHAIFNSNELKSQLQKKQLELARCRHADGTCGKADNQALAKIEKEISLIEMHLRFASDAYDPVVQAYLRYIIKYSDATKDWKIAIEWDEFLNKLAVSGKLKDAIVKDLKSILWIQSNLLIEKYARAVKEDVKKGEWAERRLVSEAKKLLESIDIADANVIVLIKEVKNQIAEVARSFLVSYCNATKNWNIGINEISNLVLFAAEEKTALRLKNDLIVFFLNSNSAYCAKMSRLIGNAPNYDGVRADDLFLYVDTQLIIEKHGDSKPHNQSIRQAQVIINTMKSRLGADFCKLESLVGQVQAVHKAEFLSNPSIAKVFGRLSESGWWSLSVALSHLKKERVASQNRNQHVNSSMKSPLQSKVAGGVLNSPRANSISPTANILWIVLFVLASILALALYGSRVKNVECLATNAFVSRIEQWEHVRKTNYGRVVSRRPYYKVFYEYIVDGRLFSGDLVSEKMPEETVTVYYDVKKPSRSAAELKDLQESSLWIVVVLVVALAVLFVPINACIIYDKVRKQEG